MEDGEEGESGGVIISEGGAVWVREEQLIRGGCGGGGGGEGGQFVCICEHVSLSRALA